MTPPTLPELVRVFARIGILSFGGPAAQIALMHRELVETRPWLSEQTFLRALSLCMMLPGPEAMQLATYAGWRLRGVPGGLLAGLLFVGPGALIIFALAVLYATYGQLPLVQAAFSGIQATVVVIVAQALVRLSVKTLIGPAAWAIAFGAFIALFAVGLTYPVVIAAAAGLGWILLRSVQAPAPPLPAKKARPWRTLCLWSLLWGAPVLALYLYQAAFLLEVAVFFSKLAVVSFGGAYAVLAYMTQTVVTDNGWLSTAQMIDALGLAETTPGPLILVTQFVATLAGSIQGGIGLAIAASITALWVTFVPCFLWIFLTAPHLDQIASRPGLAAALSGITAGVVGVILNLAIWFSIHVVFCQVDTVPGGELPLPVWHSLDFGAVVLIACATLLLQVLRRGILETLVIMSVAGTLISLIA